MKAPIMALVAGALFATGLVLSGMTQPAKIVSFLDVTGDWDPSLMFVMAGAIGAYLPAHRLILKRAAPLFDSRYLIPTRRDVDGKLLLGASLFGVGWGLGGFCPGPALTSTGTGGNAPLLVTAAMLLGMFAYRLYDARRVPQRSPSNG